MYLALLTSASHDIVLVLSGKSRWGLLLGLILVVCLRVLIVALSLSPGPASLAQLCRLCIRRHLGRSCLYTVPKLRLPEPLENFLLYR